MTQPDTDASVLANIQRLVSEEHRLFERSELDPEESRRLSTVQTELDQCWDLLRQRRALREFCRSVASACPRRRHSEEIHRMSCTHLDAVESKNRHATKHYHTMKHPIVTSLEPGETWSWCYVDEEVLEIP